MHFNQNENVFLFQGITPGHKKSTALPLKPRHAYTANLLSLTLLLSYLLRLDLLQHELSRPPLRRATLKD